jgi:hypothetical protein
LGWSPPEIPPSAPIPPVVTPPLVVLPEPEPPVYKNTNTDTPLKYYFEFSSVPVLATGIYGNIFHIVWSNLDHKAASLTAKEFYVEYKDNGVIKTLKLDILKTTEPPNIPTPNFYSLHEVSNESVQEYYNLKEFGTNYSVILTERSYIIPKSNFNQ